MTKRGPKIDLIVNFYKMSSSLIDVPLIGFFQNGHQLHFWRLCDVTLPNGSKLFLETDSYSQSDNIFP